MIPSVKYFRVYTKENLLGAWFWLILYLGELLFVDVLELGGRNDLLLQEVKLQLRILNVGSEPEECFNLRKLFPLLNK